MELNTPIIHEEGIRLAEYTSEFLEQAASSDTLYAEFATDFGTYKLKYSASEISITSPVINYQENLPFEVRVNSHNGKVITASLSTKAVNFDGDTVRDPFLNTKYDFPLVFTAMTNRIGKKDFKAAWAKSGSNGQEFYENYKSGLSRHASAEATYTGRTMAKLGYHINLHSEVVVKPNGFVYVIFTHNPS